MKRIIPFSRFGKIGLIISFIITLSLIGVTIYRGQFNLGIDFSSGQSIDIEILNTNQEEVANTLVGENFEKIQVTKTGNTGDTYNIKVPSIVETQEENLSQITQALESKFGSIDVQSTAFIGSGISQNLFRSILILTIGALALILLYIWFRFKLPFGVASLLALVHDVAFVIGIIGAFQLEITISTVAAVLTIIGYSLNDTIVIFDRIRENIILVREGSFRSITDKSLSETLSRTIITSLTTLLAVAALMIFATGDIFNFARIMAIGIIAGTWSSLFIATPLLGIFNSDKLLQLYRKSQGSGVQYSTKTATATATATSPAGNTAVASVSDKEIEKIKSEIRDRQNRKKKK